MVKRNALFFTLLFSLIFIFLLAPKTFSLGIQNVPSFEKERTIIFSPGLTKHYTLYFLGEKNFDVYVEGPLKDYFKIDDPNPGGKTRAINVTITLPQQLDPGAYMNYVIAAEIPPEGAMVGGTVAVKVRFLIISLYPGKFLQVNSFKVDDTSLDGNLHAAIIVSNYGEEDIKEVYAKITFFGHNKSITLETNKASLKSKEKTTLSVTYPVSDAGFNKGTYYATGKAYYDGKEIKLNNVSFRIGELSIGIYPVTKEIVAGDINEFIFKVKNEWDEAILAEGIVTIQNQDFPIAKFSVAGFGESNIKTFIDAKSLSPGTYEGTIHISTLEPKGKDFVQSFEIKVLPPSLEKPQATSGPSILVIVLIVIVVLLLINISFVIYFLLYKKQSQQQKRGAKVKKQKK